MAISRAQLAKELEPGLNALFGLEYDRYENEHAEIFDEEASDRAFEEEVMLGGFGTAPVKSEGGTVSFDDAQETFTARYTHETIALAFAISEEAIEDNLYDRLASRYTKALARSMAQTKQIKAAAILNNAFSTGANAIGDGAALCSSSHPSLSGNQRNLLSTAADLNETSLEQMLIDIAGFTDERGLKVAFHGGLDRRAVEHLEAVRRIRLDEERIRVGQEVVNHCTFRKHTHVTDRVGVIVSRAYPQIRVHHTLCNELQLFRNDELHATDSNLEAALVCETSNVDEHLLKRGLVQVRRGRQQVALVT